MSFHLNGAPDDLAGSWRLASPIDEPAESEPQWGGARLSNEILYDLKSMDEEWHEVCAVDKQSSDEEIEVESGLSAWRMRMLSDKTDEVEQPPGLEDPWSKSDPWSTLKPENDDDKSKVVEKAKSDSVRAVQTFFFTRVHYVRAID